MALDTLTMLPMAAGPATSQDKPWELPRLERPTRDHAIAFARALFLRGERVDMNTLSAALGIGRTTLYRWVGDRETLIGEVLGELVDRAWEYVRQEAKGSGRERALDAGRRFMELTANYPPMRQFAEREPQLALRVLLDQDGLVAQRIRAGFEAALADNLPDANIDPEVIQIAVQAGTALEWTPIAIGGEPEIERAGLLIRSLFDVHIG